MKTLLGGLLLLAQAQSQSPPPLEFPPVPPLTGHWLSPNAGQITVAPPQTKPQNWPPNGCYILNVSNTAISLVEVECPK